MSALELAIAVYRKAGHPTARARVYGAELLAMHSAELLPEVADLFESYGRSMLDGGIMTGHEAAELLREHAAATVQEGKDTREHQADESTQPAPELVPLAEAGEGQ